jgi:putative transposase
MARLPRLSIGGQLHLVLQRAHDQQRFFAEAAERSAYLSCLAEAAARYNVSIHAYGILPDEVRLLATPQDPQALGRMVQHVGRCFGSRFNQKRSRRGPLWEGRFRSTVVESAPYFLHCLRFVERADPPARDDGGAGHPSNPVEPSTPWSSRPHHEGMLHDPIISEHAQYWALGNTPFDRNAAYRRIIETVESPGLDAEIASAALHGWALGSERFLRLMGSNLDRPLRPRRAGRPRTLRTRPES